jgi:hypothetical protein
VFTDSLNTYEYWIDTQRWVITRLYITGVIVYDATYLWGLYDSTYYLRRVAIYGDTLLEHGGLDFHDIFVNGTLVPQSGVRGVPGVSRGHVVPHVRFTRQGSLFVRGPARRSVRVALHDLQGRRLFAVALPGGGSTVGRVGVRDGATAAGVRVARFECGTCGGAATASLLCR